MRSPFVLPLLLAISLFACNEKERASASGTSAQAVPTASGEKVAFGERVDLEAGTKIRIESATKFEIKVGNAYQTRASFSLETTYEIVDEQTGTLSVQFVKHSEQTGEAEPVVETMEDVEIRVNRDDRAMTRTDGQDLPKGMRLVLQGAVGSPTLRDLRKSLLAGKTLVVGEWHEIPAEIFAATAYQGRGFEGGRYQVVEPETESALLHIEVSGPKKTVDLRVTLLRDTLRATTGTVRTRVETDVNGQSKVVLVEADYANRYL